MPSKPHVYNAQIQALSTMFHNMAVASVAGGALIPLLQSYAGADETLSYIVTMPIGVALAFCFAMFGQIMLRDLYAPEDLKCP